MKDIYDRRYMSFILYQKQLGKGIDYTTLDSFMNYVQYCSSLQKDIDTHLIHCFTSYFFHIENCSDKKEFMYNFFIFFSKYNNYLSSKKYKKFVKIYYKKLEELQKKLQCPIRIQKIQYLIDTYKTFQYS